MDEETWLDDVYRDYDSWKGWSGGTSAQERRLIDIELARTGVSPPARVLEIGFGSGAFLLYLQSLGFECWGIERRDEHDAELERLGLTIRSGEMSDLPSEHFDLVCAMDVFEHLEKPDIIAMLRKVRTVLKPGGRLLARFPNGASPFGAMNQSADLTHLTLLSITSFSQACRIAGLDVVGGWNSAVSWRGEGLLRSIVKPITLAGRRLVEIALGGLFYGERRALDMNVTVCAERCYDDKL
ncbi:class I SAM-dependent methyltransferase [uncultured Sphingomonas sp.]|uniref:class I SAM-dependent methyltransferase n=1 Tax=uncultured Sphingomonas sp. TaxID=158754 RepID=UPI0025E773E7|nr:class I SAM-dependent methyltransferase [uncultured Sphingomonas sp.]